MRLDKMKEYVIWAKKSEKRSKYTLRDYEQVLSQFIAFAKEQDVTKLEEVTPRLIRHYLLFLAEKGLEEYTINKHIRYLKASFNILWEEEDWGDNNLFKKVSLYPENLDAVQPLEDEYVSALLEGVDRRSFISYRNYCCMLLMLDTGIRPSELTKLHKSDVHDGFIVVRGAISKDREKRLLPISLETAKELHKYVYKWGHWGGDILFPNQNGDYLTTHGLYQALRKMAKRKGLDPKKVTPYAFRHTFALNYLKGGGDVLTLQRILGHSSLEMTRRYVQLTITDLQDVHDKVSPVYKYIKKQKTRLR